MTRNCVSAGPVGKRLSMIQVASSLWTFRARLRERGPGESVRKKFVWKASRKLLDPHSQSSACFEPPRRVGSRPNVCEMPEAGSGEMDHGRAKSGQWRRQNATPRQDLDIASPARIHLAFAAVDVVRRSSAAKIVSARRGRCTNMSVDPATKQTCRQRQLRTAQYALKPWSSTVARLRRQCRYWNACMSCTRHAGSSSLRHEERACALYAVIHWP
ncbi:unnamed protein product [Effrenium voratum]|nr:unnamed protein product [Effrenium voratum]